jgi:hypothetical protein
MQSDMRATIQCDNLAADAIMLVLCLWGQKLDETLTHFHLSSQVCLQGSPRFSVLSFILFLPLGVLRFLAKFVFLAFTIFI